MPPLPRPDSEKLKREPQSLECCRAWAYVIGLGVNEKVQNTGEPMPNFFLMCGLYGFLKFDFFFQILSPPPHPPHKGSTVFLNIGLTQTCIATAVTLPHMGTLLKLQEDDKKMQNNS